MFYQETLPNNFGCYPVLIACLQSEIDTGEKWPLCAKKPNQQIYFVYMERVPFHVGCLFLYEYFKRDVVVVIEVGAYIYVVPIFTRCLFCVGAYYPDFTLCQ